MLCSSCDGPIEPCYAASGDRCEDCFVERLIELHIDGQLPSYASKQTAKEFEPLRFRIDREREQHFLPYKSKAS